MKNKLIDLNLDDYERVVGGACFCYTAESDEFPMKGTKDFYECELVCCALWERIERFSFYDKAKEVFGVC